MQNWWKYLGVILIIYVLIAGMILPLKPGIIDVQPSSIKAGQPTTLTVTGYNSSYKSAESYNAWIKHADYTLKAQSIKVLDDQHMEVSFMIPSGLPTATKVKDFTLILDDKKEGTSVMPSAVFINQPTATKSTDGWANMSESLTSLHKKAGIHFPYRNILVETIRNTFFHVALWMAMFSLFLVSLYHSARYLGTRNLHYDMKAMSYTSSGVLYGMLGLATGMVWAKYTWGSWWTNDVKLNMTAISMLIYLAYFVLRQSFDDHEKRARISAVYNIFAFAASIPLIFVVPRLTDSLHPGNGGNPAFGSQDLENTLRMVFYPAVIGWFLLGLWMANLLYRVTALKDKILSEQFD